MSPRILRFDSIGGASGDMILAALSDLGADLEAIRDSLRRVIPESFDIEVEKVTRGGLRGSRVTVATPCRRADPIGTDGDIEMRASEHAHAHEDADHGKSHAHRHAAGAAHDHAPAVASTDGNEGTTAAGAHHHRHRGLRDIELILNNPDLPGPVRERALDAFKRLAQAEAHVHGTTPEAVHFHEVGAVDAMVDIVGACLALEQLRVTAVQVGPLPLGSGELHCDHGIMPIPAPATLELLIGHPVHTTGERYELVTPTGATLLMSWKSAAVLPPPPWRIVRAGYGFGARTLNSRPNLLRASLLEPVKSCDDDQSGIRSCQESLDVLETNLDDCPAEWIGALFERLPEHGALDIWTTPIGMKRSRPGTLLSVLCRAEDSARIAGRLFRETSTLGIRVSGVNRLALERSVASVDTPFGAVRVKQALLDGGVVNRKPEFADCERLASELGVAPREVALAALRARDTQRPDAADGSSDKENE